MGKLDLLKLSALIIMSIIFALISTPDTTIGQDDGFPVVNNYQMLDYSFISSFRISNTGQYVAVQRVGSVWLQEVEAFQDMPIFYTSQFLRGWDADSERLAVASTGRRDCEFPNVETTLIIYNLVDDTASYQCLPFVYTDFDIHWSPVSQNTLLINDNWIFMMDTNEILPAGELFPYPSLTTVTDMFIDYRDGARDYTALDKYIWDDASDIPLLKIMYSELIDNDAQEVTRSFIMCGLWTSIINPTSCTNSINIPADTDVVSYDLATQDVRMLLWVGIESTAESASYKVYLPEYKDTVIYMTNLITRETRELFRLSDMSDEKLFFYNFADWSPNGETFAMNIAKFAGEEPRRKVPDSDRTLILTLDWDDLESEQ